MPKYHNATANFIDSSLLYATKFKIAKKINNAIMDIPEYVSYSYLLGSKINEKSDFIIKEKNPEMISDLVKYLVDSIAGIEFRKDLGIEASKHIYTPTEIGNKVICTIINSIVSTTVESELNFTAMDPLLSKMIGDIVGNIVARTVENAPITDTCIGKIVRASIPAIDAIIACTEFTIDTTSEFLDDIENYILFTGRISSLLSSYLIKETWNGLKKSGNSLCYAFDHCCNKPKPQKNNRLECKEKSLVLSKPNLWE